MGFDPNAIYLVMILKYSIMVISYFLVPGKIKGLIFIHYTENMNRIMTADNGAGVMGGSSML